MEEDTVQPEGRSQEGSSPPQSEAEGNGPATNEGKTPNMGDEGSFSFVQSMSHMLRLDTPSDDKDECMDFNSDLPTAKMLPVKVQP